jgi:hypothetical protein
MHYILGVGGDVHVTMHCLFEQLYLADLFCILLQKGVISLLRSLCNICTN